MTHKKTPTLLQRVAQLALEKPSLRPKLMPLIRKASGGMVSWRVLLGGDPRNWAANWQETEGASWNDMLRLIMMALKGTRTDLRGVVAAVRVERDKLAVFVKYNRPVDAETALYDAEAAISKKLGELANRNSAMEWAIHGTVGGLSNLELTDEAVESWF